MKSHSVLKKSFLAIAAGALLLTSACSSPAPVIEDNGSGDKNPGTSDTSNQAGGSGDYAFGADRDVMTEAIEAAFSSSNGKGRWEGDTFVLAIDGDATKTMAGFTECLVLDSLLNEGDILRIEFPNGTIQCEDFDD